MAEIRRFFATLRHIAPTDLEYYLEEEHSSGHALEPLGQTGLLYLKFIEKKPEKCAYMVDLSALPKALYIRTLAEKGWEPMGQAMNCYIWRQYYEEGKRPENLSDRFCLRAHCLRLGIVMLAAAFVFLGLAAAYMYLLWLEHQKGIQEHFWKYLIFSLLQLPFFGYTAWAARKLFDNARALKNRLEAGKLISRKEKNS